MSDSLILLASPPGSETSALLAGLGPRLEFDHVPELPDRLDGSELLWVHRGPLEEAEDLDAAARERLRSFVAAGGRLLLTGSPAVWLGHLGIESRPPRARVRTWEGPLRSEDRLGVAPFLEHPLFERFPGGVYLRKPEAGCAIGGAFWAAGERPADGRLIGVERVWLGMQADTGLLVEHDHGAGRVLSLGAHLVFDAGDAADPFEEARLRFTADLVEYLLVSEETNGAHTWPEPGAQPRVSRGLEVSAPEIAPPPAGDGPTLEAAGDAFFDLTTRTGGLLLGTRDSGVTEIWHTPVRLFRDLEWRVSGATCTASALTVGHDSVERALAGGLRERWERAGGDLGRVHGSLRNDGEDATVELVVRGDARLMWPYPASALGGFDVAASEDGSVLEVHEPRSDHAGLFAFSDAPVASTLEAKGAGFEARLRFQLAAGSALSWRVALAGSRALARERMAEARTAVPEQRGGASVEVDDPARTEELGWVVAGGDRLCVTTAEPFRGVLAGLDTTRPGWCSGRPGHAWFFGRDSLWAARGFRSAGLGGPDLTTFAAKQGPRGEILHELTPAGVAHYDAADATPLFVDALARHVDWTGEEELAAGLFPAVERALGFVQEHDRDGDGITENSGVGHGWTAGGPLGEGAHAELALAAFQAAALASGARLATLAGSPGRAAAWSTAAARARQVIDEQFLDRESLRYAFALRKDGSFDRTPTALGVLPVVLGQCDSRVAGRVMEQFARADFATDWGVRMLPQSDARYDPDGYQHGTVWPFLTAQVALADFLSGRPDVAWEHLTSVLSLVRLFQPGLLEETYRGDVCEPTGVCRHAASGHAGVLQAVYEGLLGARPKQDGTGLELALSVPASCDRIGFSRMPFRDGTVDVRFTRGADGAGASVEVDAPCAVDVACYFPAPCRVREVRDGAGVREHETEELAEGLRVWVRGNAAGAVKLQFHVVPDLLLAPRTLGGRPGQPAREPRLVYRHATPDGADVRLGFSAPGGVHTYPLRLPGRGVASVAGGRIEAGALHVEVPGSAGAHHDHEVRVSFAAS